MRRELPWSSATRDRVTLLGQWTIPEYGAVMRPRLERLGVWSRMGLWGEYAVH